MAIATQNRTFSRTLLLLGVISLVACGGGGGGKKKPKDTTPEAFSFTASTNAATSAVVTSPVITVTGIDAPAAVSITGGEYSISGGAFTSGTGKVSSGQTIAVKVIASSATNKPVEAVLSVGGVSAAFRVTTAPDVTPAAYSFAPATDAALSTAITSAPVTLSGFDVAVPISITNGEYSINGGAFTSAAGTISPAQTLAVKVVSSNANSTAVEATLNVGGVNATYRVTTLADAVPNAFTFTPAVNVPPNSVNTSSAITVGGIDTAVPITITGGEYSINGGAFTSAAGTVTNGQTIAVKAVAAAGTELTQNTVVTIGGVNGTYAVTTLPDTTAPVAEFKFPTPYTMSEAMSVKVRGTATDEHAISSVKVVVTNNLNATATEIQAIPKTAGDFSSWTAEVPLTALSENEIKVVAVDDRNNTTVVNDANKVVIRQASVASAFPDEMNEFSYIFAGLVLDRYEDRNRLLITDSTLKKIIAIDIKTGMRTEFSNKPTGNNSPGTLAIDPLSKRLFVAASGPLYEINILDGSIVNKFDTSFLDGFYDIAIETINNATNLVFVENEYLAPGKMAKFSLTDNQLEIISDEDKLPGLEDVFGLAVDEINNRYLVASGGQNADESVHQIVAVDRTTGTRSVFSSNVVGNGDLFSAVYGGDSQLNSAVVDKAGNSLIVAEYPNKLFSIDLSSGNRRILSDVSYKNTAYAEANPNAIELDEDSHSLFFIEGWRKAIIIVDLDTGEKVILSKSKNND